jgi:hypothetical protein
MVAAYWFRSAKTGASASRECSSCEGLRILGVHVHDEVSVCGKESHLAFRIATIGAVCVGLDELPDSEAIRGFLGEMVTCLLMRVSLRLKNGPGFEKRLDPVLAIFTADAGVFESAPGRLRIVRHAVDHDAPGPYL